MKSVDDLELHNITIKEVGMAVKQMKDNKQQVTSSKNYKIAVLVMGHLSDYAKQRVGEGIQRWSLAIQPW